MKKILISLTLLFLVLSAFAQGNYRDIVHLNNGSIIKGVIVEQVPGQQIKIETADGSLFVYQLEEIEKMTKEPVPVSGLRIGTSTSNLSSPTAKGAIIISGSTNFAYSSMTNERIQKSSYFGTVESEYDANQFNFSPSIGWFVADGLAIGVSINYKSGKQEYEDEEYKESSILVGPSIAYYFGSSNIKPFIQGEYLFGNSKSEYENEYQNEESKTKISGWGLGAGVAFFVNQHISLNLGLGYAKMSGENDDDDDDNDLEMTSKGATFNGGVSIYF